jgi:hypothetical protein
MGEEQHSPKGLLSIEPANPTCVDMAGGEYANRQRVSKLIRFWRGFARRLIAACGKDPNRYSSIARKSNELDAACAAAKVLMHLDRLEAYLQAAYRAGGPATAPATEAVHQALLLLSSVHQMAVIDNETAIDARIRSVAGAAKGGRKRATSHRDKEMAGEYVRRRVDEKRKHKSDSALKEEIGKEMHGLERRASIDAINRGLKNFVRDPGQPAQT